MNMVPDNVMAVRLCRTPDGKRTVAVWAMYYDIYNNFPNKGWLPPDTPTPPPFEVRSFNNKGRGLVATRDVKRGEVILNERPVLMIPYLMPQNNPSKKSWRDSEEIPLRMLYVLEQEDREKVVRLHNCKSLASYGPLGGIFMTNAVAIFFPNSRLCSQYVAICLTLSYINHSCLPNAAYESNADTVVFTVRAKRDIARGEEITLCYINTEDLRTAERQRQLREKYGFMCDCKLCSDGPASDRRRDFILNTSLSVKGMMDKWNEHGLDRAGRTAEAKHISETIEEMLRAMDEEDIEEYDGRKKVIDLCIGLYAVLGDRKSFLKWVIRGLGSESILKRKQDSRVVKELQGMLEKPASHTMWDVLAIDSKNESAKRTGK